MSNPIVHWELMVTDLDKGKAFYSAVFDWKFDESTYPGYTLIDTGSPPGGGMLAKPETAPGAGKSLDQFYSVWKREVHEPGQVVLGPLGLERYTKPARVVQRGMYGVVATPLVKGSI
jgi:predicted enzyme related to lactoylglutathione lyase